MSTDHHLNNEEDDVTKMKKKRILYCLDFDGVLCDSVNETFYSGLRACQLLWGHNKCQSNEEEEVETWLSKLVHKNDDGNTTNVFLEQVLEDFRYVRPILYVGWESILLIQLLATHQKNRVAVRDKILHSFHGNMSRNFDIADDDGAYNSPLTKEYAMQQSSVSEAEYSTAMSNARKSWIAEKNTTDVASSSSWIDAHGFYDGACQSVRDYLALNGNTDIYIITTKAKEFALQLLEKQKLVGNNVNKVNSNNEISSALFLQESHIYGLGSGPKADVLQLILQERQEQDETYDYVAVMVEDNIATLDKITNSTVHNFGNQVQPVVASWGYNTHAQLMTVFLNNNTNTNFNNTGTSIGSNNNHQKGVYIVLPPLPESSTPTGIKECSTINYNKNTMSKAEADVKYCKANDLTGSSLSVVLETSFLS